MNDDILKIYLREINNVPLLSRDEEVELAKKAKNGDKQAKNKIVQANLRFVVNIAKKYQNQGIDLCDLISEGNIGLLTAIDRFDVAKGYHFISYAVWWIRQAILKAIGEKSRAIRVPQNCANELVRIKHAKKAISGNKNENEELEEIARMLDMDKKHILEMINISKDMISLDAPVSSYNENNMNLANTIEDTSFGAPDSTVMLEAFNTELNNVINTLKPKEATVLRMRYGIGVEKPMSLHEVAKHCNLSKERIRQIEKNALRGMQYSKRKERLEAFVA